MVRRWPLLRRSGSVSSTGLVLGRAIGLVRALMARRALADGGFDDVSGEERVHHVPGRDPVRHGRARQGRLRALREPPDSPDAAARLRAQHWLMLLCLRVQGEEGDPLTIPPAFHVPAPFGTNIGPPNPLFYAVSALHRDHVCSFCS